MKEAVAFAPSHITGLFQIFDQSAEPLRIGSRGAGICLELGAITTVNVRKGSKSSVKVKINNHAADARAPVSRQVVNMFLSRYSEMRTYEILVDHQIGTPIGAGFGMSGAAALSLAIALNEVFDLGMTRIEAAQIAHTSEIKCKTGLGTVIAETVGGLEIRIKPGAPGIAEVKSLRIPENTKVACLTFGPLSTKKYLTDRATRTRINRFGGRLIDELIEKPTIINFMKLSRQFAENVGLITKRVRSIFDVMDETGVVCSMPMFGESAFTVSCGEVGQILRNFRELGRKGNLIVSKIDREGARLLQ